MKEILEIKLVEFISLSLIHSNNFDFGRECRKIFDCNECNRDLPNDEDLGKFVRKYLKEIKK